MSHTLNESNFVLFQDLNLDGRHHSGIDDCHNIAKVVKELAKRGYVFRATNSKT
jgi:ERI1 exoribonuclease 3